MSAVLCDLEFVVDPFDGYRQLLSIDPGQLVDFATFPVSPTIIRMMNGEMPGPIVPGHMVAIYELHHSQDSDHDIYQVDPRWTLFFALNFSANTKPQRASLLQSSVRRADLIFARWSATGGLRRMQRVRV